MDGVWNVNPAVVHNLVDAFASQCFIPLIRDWLALENRDQRFAYPPHPDIEKQEMSDVAKPSMNIENPQIEEKDGCFLKWYEYPIYKLCHEERLRP